MRLSIATLLTLLLLASQSLAYTIKDGKGAIFEFEKAPTKVISLTPSVTEIIYALNAENSLIAVSRFCDYPEAAKQKPKVGGFVDTDFESIARLKPDIVILKKITNARIEKKLKALRIPCFYLNGEGLEYIAADIRLIGSLLQKQEKAESLAKKIDALVQKKSENDNLPDSTKTRAIFLFGEMAAGKNSYIGDTLQVCGFKNCADVMNKAWGIMTREQILRTNPEIIFVAISSESEKENIARKLKTDPIWRATSAVKNNSIIFLKRDIFIVPALRIIDAIKILQSYSK